ncbi:MAG: hypothetical protein C0616_03205 [Desulfuromonas sp.]|nr:MAG: hypothetical protein C0616_03205 [Desulfuromonas sp.]
MKRLVSICLVVLLLGLASTAVAVDGKIGFVDLQKALNLSDSGKMAKEKMRQQVTNYETQLDEMRSDLEKSKEEMDKQALLLSEDARSAKERDYQQKVKEFKRFANDIKEELQIKDSEFTRKILDDLLAVVLEIGKKEGFTVIFEKNESSLIYADEKIDLTDQVIAAANAKQK